MGWLLATKKGGNDPKDIAHAPCSTAGAPNGKSRLKRPKAKTALRPRKRKKRPSAKPSQLERIEHRYEIAPAQRAQGQSLKRIGEEISEQLD
ncbi:MAG: hypothetical protein WEK74_05985, partial [Hydrogenophaga sp.]